MDLSTLGFSGTRETVVVLGAGATRGASFVPAVCLHKPPVDTDFFLQLSRSDLRKDSHVEKLMEFVNEEFGGLDVGMEAFYSQVQLYDKFVGEVPKGGKGRARKYEYSLRYFLEAVPGLLKQTLSGQRCEHHDTLVRELAANDTIVSFNYDCLADRSVVDIAGRRWDPAVGYGIPASGDLSAWRKHAGTGRFPKTPITLLKPHGSINWSSDGGGGVALVPDEYSLREPGDLMLVPPLWVKSFESEPFAHLWSSLRRKLSTTKSLIFIGYSLPPTDVFTQAALRLDVKELEFLGIVNPDKEARSRIRGVLRSAISTRTTVTEVDYLHELALLLNA